MMEIVVIYYPEQGMVAVDWKQPEVLMIMNFTLELWTELLVSLTGNFRYINK